MLQYVDGCLQEASVPYWITGGTLLGAMRHGGFIPHDDDIDLEVRASDWPRAMEALGAVGRSFRGMGEWPNSGVEYGRIFFWGEDRRFTVSLDIFFRKEHLEALDEFPSDREVFPLRRIAFHHLSVCAPDKAGPFLSRCYGSSWASEAMAWSHSRRRAVRLPLADYEAAVLEAGYQPPAPISLVEAGLTCPGELREHMCQQYGWGSAWPMECDGVEKPDSTVLEALGLQLRHFPLRTSAQEVMKQGCLQDLAESTGVSLTLEESNTALSLCAVGDSEELDSVGRALRRLDVLACA
eukprot:TRINITY_DN107692_c0_g1_i1.p1 TRINITY_DN107692_c0_g1~~TRINITY_DN107692_c0_g1_i1.p1  ORF type:complete len:336 (+),score=51.67 TRINITY_DN107692_c0_g1_i1:126-1010(+)